MSTATQTWPSFRVDDHPLEGKTLMARDRDRLLTLEKHPELGPSLFLFRWNQPTVTVGYLQRPDRDLDLAQLQKDSIAVVRRPTGGRAILHDQEWTYSVVSPIDDPQTGGTLQESYRRIAQIIVEALRGIGVECHLASTDLLRARPRRTVAGSPACFSQTLGFELMHDGKKLVGSAQRRLIRTYLQQGSILVGSGHLRLVDYLNADSETRSRSRQELLESTTTVRDSIGSSADFNDFANSLKTSWSRGRGESRPEASKP